MNRLVVPKLQHHLRSFSRSHRACLSVQPVLRMSASSLIQRHGISHSRVNVCGQHSWSKPSRSGTNFRIQKYDSLIVRNGYANENKTSGGVRPTSQNQFLLEACGVVAVEFRAETLTSCCDSVIHFRDYAEFAIIYHEFQIIQNTTRSPLESWKLWQTMNRSVKDIGRRQGLTEFQVYEQICECVQQGKEIDWFDLCNEAGFSPAVVWDINDAKAKAEEAMNEPLGQRLDEFGLVPVQCGPHVTDVHVLLYNTMMACGITPQEMFVSSLGVQPIQIPEKSPSNKAPLSSKTTNESKRVAPADVPAPGNRLPNVKITPSDKNPGTEETDTKKAPKRLTQKHMLQWMADRNGVTLMELVQEFQGYNECQLMRLILSMERKKLIQLSKGIFRVTSSDEEQTV